MLAPEDQCYSIKLYSIVFTRIYVLELHDFNNNVAGTLMSSFVLAYYPFYATLYFWEDSQTSFQNNLQNNLNDSFQNFVKSPFQQIFSQVRIFHTQIFHTLDVCSKKLQPKNSTTEIIDRRIYARNI